MELDKELMAQYHALDDRAKAILITAARDPELRRRLSIARLYIPGAPDHQLAALLDRLRLME